MNKKYSAALKAKVALAAIQGELTMAQISSRFKVHPTQIAKWKKQLLQDLPGIFEGKRGAPPASDVEVDQLYQEIGKLKVENEWLKKNLWNTLYIDAVLSKLRQEGHSIREEDVCAAISAYL